MDEINAGGGILGKKVVLEVADEGPGVPSDIESRNVLFVAR